MNDCNKLNCDESIGIMISSEKSLKKDWDNEADERWNNILSLKSNS